MIRVVLPGHLRALARVGPEIQLHVEGPVTQRSVLDALEAQLGDITPTALAAQVLDVIVNDVVPAAR